VIRTKRFVKLLARLGVRQDPGPVSERYIEHLGTASFLVDGAREFLDTVFGCLPMVLLTNGLSAVQRSRFAQADMERYFRGVVISEEVGVQKPDPEVFRIAVERAGIDRRAGVANGAGVSTGARRPIRALMVGDSLHSDVKGALAAGLDACWFNLRDQELDPEITPTYTVRSLSEILPILGL
jgi:FMN phosphatase YigB (HAD superfamily)